MIRWAVGMCWCFWAASAVAVSGRNSYFLSHRAPPMVGELTHTVVQDQLKAKIDSLTSRADTALVRQRELAAEGEALRYKTEKVKYITEAQTEGVEHALINARGNTNVAVAKSAETSAILENAKKNVAAQVQETKVLAHNAVLRNLRKMYKELDEWQKKVLRDPYKEAQEAGAKAAEPYHKMITTLHNRQNEYMLTARALSDKANALANGAQGLAASAGEKQAVGDTIGASQDLANAQAMAANSQALSSQASALQGQASAISSSVSQYLAHGHMASWAAMYKADPDGLPPPPHDPDAFIPPQS